MMNKNNIKKSILFVLFVLLVLSKPVLAADDDSDEAKAAEKVTEETVAKSLKDKLEEAATDKLEKTKSLLSKKDGLYAYVGTISEIEENIITIETKKGRKKAEITEKSTIVFYKDKKEIPIKTKDIETDSYVIAMGEMQDNETILITRIMLSAGPDNPSEKKVIFGKIEEIDSKEVKIKNKEELKLKIPKELNLKIAGVKSPKIADVELEDKVIIVLQKDEKDKDYGLTAMYVIPGKHSTSSEENQLSATESAEIASPSAEEK